MPYCSGNAVNDTRDIGRQNMFGKFNALALTLTLGLMTIAGSALAQRPPSGSQGPPQMSIEKAWDWLMARPGVIVAILIIVAAIVYMFLTRKKKST
jgi:hypothetical protein